MKTGFRKEACRQRGKGHFVRNVQRLVAVLIPVFLWGCGSGLHDEAARYDPGTYGYDRIFLENRLDVIELSRGDARIVLAPAYQGRVMTSTCAGDSGVSFGWINYELIRSGAHLPHMNPYGGEERLWLGPEGGQYSLFFRPGDPFDVAHWQTPAPFDTEPFALQYQSAYEATFTSTFSLINRFGTNLQVAITRTVKLLARQEIAGALDLVLPDSLQAVAYASSNRLTNKGDSAWTKDTGLVSIWMLGMMQPSPSVTVVIPIHPGDQPSMGPKLNAAYFGPIPADGLIVRDSVVFFKADGKMRGKLGIPPERAKSVLGSYDEQHHTLTLLKAELPAGETAYVNSLWEEQEHPYAGDALNAYNDGPLADGSQLGPFYELEASSPAAQLLPGQSIIHNQITFHFTGDEALLSAIAYRTLGVTLAEIRSAIK